MSDSLGLMDSSWKPSALVKFSLAVHAAALGALASRPSQWHWAAGALVANHAVLAASGLWPRSSLLGPNWTRLPGTAAAAGNIAITIDDGPDPEITPKILDVLDRYGCVATFFCIGDRVAAQPTLAREILRRGHTLENHSRRHPHYFSLLGPGAMAAEISSAQELISSTVGTPPLFFRAPAGLRNPFLDWALSRQGLTLASWTRRGFDTVTRNPATVLARLTKGLRAGDILLLHDGHAARMADGSPVVLQVLPALLEVVRSAGLTPITLRAAMTPPTPAKDCLAESAAARYRSSGPFAYHFAKGKLSIDPVFTEILARSLIPSRARILDLGCGQGLLAAWLLAARQCRLDSPSEWTFHGIELMPKDVQRARAALGDSVTVECGDIRFAEFGVADVVVILDVLHYMNSNDQESVLKRAVAALSMGGTLLLRVGDAGAGLRFRISRWVDQTVLLGRGHGWTRLYCRPVREWMELLQGMGFQTQALPMSLNTPFANVLLVARLPCSR